MKNLASLKLALPCEVIQYFESPSLTTIKISEHEKAVTAIYGKNFVLANTFAGENSVIKKFVVLTNSIELPAFSFIIARNKKTGEYRWCTTSIEDDIIMNAENSIYKREDALLENIFFYTTKNSRRTYFFKVYIGPSLLSCYTEITNLKDIYSISEANINASTKEAVTRDEVEILEDNISGASSITTSNNDQKTHIFTLFEKDLKTILVEDKVGSVTVYESGEVSVFFHLSFALIVIRDFSTKKSSLILVSQNALNNKNAAAADLLTNKIELKENTLENLSIESKKENLKVVFKVYKQNPNENSMHKYKAVPIKEAIKNTTESNLSQNCQKIKNLIYEIGLKPFIKKASER